MLRNPRSDEYEVRKEENKRYAASLGIPFVDLDGGVAGGIDVDEWYRRAKGMEFCPERGTRCSMCFDMRLERTALYAYEHGFDCFTTTNATSRWKDEAQVNTSGMKAASKYEVRTRSHLLHACISPLPAMPRCTCVRGRGSSTG